MSVSYSIGYDYDLKFTTLTITDYVANRSMSIAMSNEATQKLIYLLEASLKGNTNDATS